MERNSANNTGKNTLKSAGIAVGLFAVLGGAVMIGNKANEQTNDIGRRLDVAARHDGFNGVTEPVFLDKPGVATSAIMVGKCLIRPVTMVYHEQNNEVTEVDYKLEATPYMENAHSKRLDALVNGAGMLEIDFHTSTELHNQLGGDPCAVLNPVLMWRNLRPS
jgi:hypothetical protein